jgi:pyruvate/2-oxoglutarate dehydrogenase complex dihydrolipoamide dehydrogenase (E3) component
MNKPQHFDICIIGAGSAGLTMAAVSSNLGFKVALIEGHKMGGDCLNYGCVPSKALIAMAKQKEADFNKVKAAIQTAIETIEPNDSEERFEGMGVHVIKEYASFLDKNTIQAGAHTITAKRFIIATGSKALIPSVPGIENIPFLTNETIFDLEPLPEKLIILGGGAIGVEMAFAFQKLGSQVTLIERYKHILPHSELEASQHFKTTLKNINVKILDNATTSCIKKENKGISLELDGEKITGTHILIATGRQANLEKLNLKNAGIDHTANSITVDDTLRTNQKHIYAIGDCSSKYLFTHNASYEAGIVIKRMLFGMFWSKVKYNALPKVHYIDPELAEVGLTQEQAEKKYGKDNIRVIQVPFTENDRAVCDQRTDGFIKAILSPKGYVYGVTILGNHAGELITPWATLMTYNRKISDFSGVTAPYPTYSEIHKKVASAFYKDAFYGKKVQRISKILFRILG